MARWSSENATKAFLQSLKMGERGKEPDVAEFISALAAGNNARLMVVACSGIAAASSVTTTLLALVAAAHQTGGRVVVCVLSRRDDGIDASKQVLGRYADSVEFVKAGGGGDAQKLLANEYKGADFVLIDCNIEGHKEVFRAAKESVKLGANGNGGVIVGYNAPRRKGSSSWSEWNTHFLPIGEGLLITRVGAGNKRRSRWVVTVDKCTGEEHVFRIPPSPLPSPSLQKVIKA